MPTSTPPSHNSTRHWARRGLASALALAGACGRPQPSPLTPGAEPELRIGLVAGAPSVTLGGDGELFITDEANGEPIGSIPQSDGKSTRLNSSHRCISYAVFCLKKKKTTLHVTSVRSTRHEPATIRDTNR